MGIDYEEKAFYDILVAVAEKFQFEFPDSENIKLAKEIHAALRNQEKYADWANSIQIKAQMQSGIITILYKHGYPPTPPEIYIKVCNDILEQAENFKKYNDGDNIDEKLVQPEKGYSLLAASPKKTLKDN